MAAGRSEKTRDAPGLGEALRALIELLRAAGDEHLTRAFAAWLRWSLRAAGGPAGGAGDALAQLQETQTMLEPARAIRSSLRSSMRR